MVAKIVELSQRVCDAPDSRKVEAARKVVAEALDRLVDYAAAGRTGGRGVSEPELRELRLARGALDLAIDMLVQAHRIEVLSEALNASLRRKR